MEFDYLGNKALDLIENNDASLFLTWKAGTGKTTLLKHFFENTSKNYIVLWSTWIAAINIGGSTIHSFFSFWKDINKSNVKKLYWKKLETLENADIIVIDEISMVRSDLLDCIDICMRSSLWNHELPFWGKQMLFVGDLYQLPPVVSQAEQKYILEEYKTEYFFSSFAFQELDPYIIELQKVYRQDDVELVKVLNKFRVGLFSQSDIDFLNTKVINPWDIKDRDIVTLTTTNKDAWNTNIERLSALPWESFVSHALIEWEFEQNLYPNLLELEFKENAQIMMLNNNEFWKNWTIGKIKEIISEEEVIVEINNNEYVVEPYEWNVLKPRYDKSIKKIVYDKVWKFIQFPFKLAWAITIHKSQWLTFDKLLIDFGKTVFAKWQAYVALSRWTNLENMYFKRPVDKKDIKVDKRITYFMSKALRPQKKDMIKYAYENNKNITFWYLKYNQEISQRTIKLIDFWLDNYNWYDYFFVKGYCYLRDQNRVFNIDKMYELEVN